jgi:sarcosine oxidase subunit beta
MNSFDVVVIGGGAIGTSVAYHVAKKGLKTALLERGDFASGTSSGCDASALICDKKPGIDTKMGYESIQLYKQYAEKFSYNFEFEQRGSIYVCETEQELEVASQYAREQANDGYPMWMMDQREIHEKEPYLAGDLIGGIWTDCDASVTPYLVCFAFIEEGKKLGLEAFHHCTVQGIGFDEKGAVKSVITDRGDFKTEKVISCAGPWSPAIGEMVGIDIPIKPRKGQILVTEKTFRIVNEKIQEFGYMLSKFEDINYERNVSKLVEKHNVAFVIEPAVAENCIIGSCRAFEGYNKKNSIEVMSALAERAIRFLPVLRDVNVIRSYAGMRPYVVDHLPVVSEVDEVPGFYIASGHEGDGICLAPITGKLMSQVVVGEPTDFNIDKLKFSRFKENAAKTSE